MSGGPPHQRRAVEEDEAPDQERGGGGAAELPREREQERRQRGIMTRWDSHSTNEDFAAKLGELKAATAASTVELPCFAKALDDRRPETRKVRGRVGAVLFEGWRVGVDHPNFERFNSEVDLLVSLTADLEAIFVQKAEAAGQIRPGDAEVRAWALMGIAKNLGDRFAMGEDQRDLESIADAAFDLIRDGLAP